MGGDAVAQHRGEVFAQPPARVLRRLALETPHLHEGEQADAGEGDDDQLHLLGHEQAHRGDRDRTGQVGPHQAAEHRAGVALPVALVAQRAPAGPHRGGDDDQQIEQEGTADRKTLQHADRQRHRGDQQAGHGQQIDLAGGAVHRAALAAEAGDPESGQGQGAEPGVGEEGQGVEAVHEGSPVWRQCSAGPGGDQVPAVIRSWCRKSLSARRALSGAGRRPKLAP